MYHEHAPKRQPLLAAGDVYGPDRDSAVPDVDWNGSHLVVRPPHLRDLDVTDPRIPGHRHEVEVDDAVCDELLHPGVRDLGPEEPGRALGDHERPAAAPPGGLHVRLDTRIARRRSSCPSPAGLRG